MRMHQTEALYNTEVTWTCRLLDVVDEVADAATAARITDAICERLAGDSVTEAAERRQAFAAETERLMASAPAARLEQLRYTRDHGGLMSPDAKAELRELEGPHRDHRT